MSRFLKRLQKEIANCGPHVQIINEKTIYAGISLPLEKIELDIIINLAKNYPFGPPNIEVNCVDYKDEILKNTTNEIVSNFTNRRCLCCDTITCRNNWTPHLTIKDCINEVIETIRIKKRILERIHMRKIQNKYFHQMDINEILKFI